LATFSNTLAWQANKEVAAKKKAKEDADDLIAQCKVSNNTG